MFLHVGGLVLDATPEQIQKIMNLYNRPGTAGEKAAAEAALRRMGVDPNTFERPRSMPLNPESTRKKRYSVTAEFFINGYTIKGYYETWGPDEVDASDELEAEAKIREKIKKYYRGKGRIEFRSMQTRRV
jgi:hypothetical protein